MIPGTSPPSVLNVTAGNRPDPSEGHAGDRADARAMG
jgi:hypothetical protein